MLVFAAAEFKKGRAWAAGDAFSSVPFVAQRKVVIPPTQQGRAGQGEAQSRRGQQQPANRSRWEMSQQRCFGLAPCPAHDLWDWPRTRQGTDQESRIGHDWSRRGGGSKLRLGVRKSLAIKIGGVVLVYFHVLFSTKRMGLQKLVVAAAVTALYMLQLKRYVIATGKMTSDKPVWPKPHLHTFDK